jgi:hypothetical protein
MKEKERNERNGQIALMLGLIKVRSVGGLYSDAFQPCTHTYNSSFYHDRIEGESWYLYLEYDSDWSWLMEAVSFINKTDFNGELLEMKRNFICTQINSDIDYVFKLVSDFAKSYNEKIKNNLDN